MLQDFTPNLIDITEKIANSHQSPNYLSEVVIYTGRMNLSVYCRNRGCKAFNISTGATSHQLVPDNTIIVGVSSDNGVEFKTRFKPTDDLKVLDGFIGDKPAQYYIINLEGMMASNAGYMRIPELSLIFGIDERELNSLELFTTEINRVSSLARNTHAVGSIIIPVVEPEDFRRNDCFYINTLGHTYELRCETTAETELVAGVYQGIDKTKYLGPLDDFIYKDQTSLEKDIVLYNSRTEAERFRSISDVMKSLADVAKAEVIKLEKELTEVKSKTTKEDNAIKVQTLKAKGDYESKSLSRKDALEETSFARSATLGFAALATASMGIILKMGATVTMADLFMAGFTTTTVKCGLLAAFVDGTFLRESVATAVSAIAFIPRIVCTIGGALVNALGDGLAFVARGVGGLARRAGNFVRRAFGFAF